MAWCKTAVAPVCWKWNYCSFAPIHRYPFTYVNDCGLVTPYRRFSHKRVPLVAWGEQTGSYKRLLEGLYVYSCDQAALQMVFSVRLSVRPSVRLSVCHTFFTMLPSSYHHEIFRSYYHGQKWCPCKRSRSKVKVTEVKTQLSRFRTLAPVWIHIWQWNHAHSWKQHRRGALLFFKVIRQISRSHGSKNRRIWPRLGVSRL